MGTDADFPSISGNGRDRGNGRDKAVCALSNERLCDLDDRLDLLEAAFQDLARICKNTHAAVQRIEAKLSSEG